jgi:hypothetical protein
VAEASGLRFVSTSEDCAAQYPELPVHAPCIYIPYFSPAGHPLERIYRVWYFDGGDTGGPPCTSRTHTPVRAAYPSGSGLPQLYCPPVCDVRQEGGILYVTQGDEGELSALSAAAHGLTAVAIESPWLYECPQWDDIPLSDRRVRLVSTSDCAIHTSTGRARTACATYLTERGAQVEVIHLPQAVRDWAEFLGAGGRMETLVSDRWSRTAALHALNDDVVYVEDPGVILIRDTGQVLRVTDFVHHAFAPRFCAVDTPSGTKHRSAAAEWIKWPHRASVRCLTYRPGAAAVLPQGPRGQRHWEWNLWSGWGMRPVSGDTGPWDDLVTYLIPDRAMRTWFLQWCAYPLKHPGAKLSTAVLLWSRTEGVGKTLLGSTLKSIYGTNGTLVRDEQLLLPFNEWAKNRQFVLGDDLTPRIKGLSLRTLITQETITINRKYLPTYDLPDCINYFFTANEPHTFALGDHDRRFFVAEITRGPLANEFYQTYARWLAADGAAHLFAALLDVDTTSFNPHAAAPWTEAKRLLVEDGRSDIAAWVARLRADPEGTLRVGTTFFPYRLWSARELVQLYDPDGRTRATANGLARELHRQGFLRVAGGGGVPTPLGQIVLWAIRDPEQLLGRSRQDLGVLYTRERNLEEHIHAIEKRFCRDGAGESPDNSGDGRQGRPPEGHSTQVDG